jgi:hypothetical protein
MEAFMKHSLPILVFTLVTAGGCQSQSDGPAQTPATVWMATEPTQCLSNAWERDWIAQHDGDEASYPRGDLYQIEPEEAEIITDDYARNDVIVSEVTSAHTLESVCAACDCPQGHTLYLSVRPQDVVKLKVFGYRQQDPAT